MEVRISIDLDKDVFVKSGFSEIAKDVYAVDSNTVDTAFIVWQNGTLIMRNSYGYVLKKILKKHKPLTIISTIKVFSEFHDWLKSEKELREKVSDLAPLTNELLAIEKETGIWDSDLAENEVKVIIKESTGYNGTGRYKFRAFIIDNGITRNEVRWFPHECKTEGSVWACVVKEYKGYGLKTIGMPRLLM